MKSLFRPCPAIAIAILFTLPLSASAQDETEQDQPAATNDPGDSEAPDPDAPGSIPVDPLVEWKTLASRKIEIFNTLQAAKKKFESAKDDTERQTIRDEFTGLISEFETAVYPQMLALADAVWEHDKTVLDAGEIAMKNAYNSNRFVAARDISAELLAADRRTRDVYRMGGMSEFALHNFAESANMLEELNRVHRPSDPGESEYLAGYIAEARKYIDLWKKEQVIRATEDALQGDAALPRVALETTRGKMIIELFEDHAPNTVASFIQTVEAKKYDGVKFHRVLPAFMAQTGDTTKNDEDSLNDTLGPGFTIPCECYGDETRMHFQGSLSMAHRGKDTGGTQFFITHLPTYWLNHEKDKDQSNHTCFGRIIEGIEAVWATQMNDEIISATVIRKRPHEYRSNRVLDEPIEPDGTLDPKKTTGDDPEGTSEKDPEKGNEKDANTTAPEKTDAAEQKPPGSDK